MKTEETGVSNWKARKWKELVYRLPNTRMSVIEITTSTETKWNKGTILGRVTWI